MADEQAKMLSNLLQVMAALRTPVTGCPWDLEQTFQTIAPFTIEEAYEVADAIARGDRADLRDELGDLLLQVVYHARLAEEEGAFAFADVVNAITEKMIRRHPHVFGDAPARSAVLAKGWWGRIKAEERAAKALERQRLAGPSSPSGAGGSSSGSGSEAESVLADVPLAMAALTRAVKLQDKAANVGFDWPSLAPVFGKMKEELAELEEALAKRADGGQPGSATDGIEEEYGDLLFVMANVARHLQLDPEAALRRANRKFTRRFGYIEARLAERGKTPAQSNLVEMDAIWNEIRAKDKEQG